MDFNTLRNEYPRFLYNDYKIYEDNEKIVVEYDFEIENLSKFNPRIEILKKNFEIKNIKEILNYNFELKRIKVMNNIVYYDLNILLTLLNSENEKLETIVTTNDSYNVDCVFIAEGAASGFSFAKHLGILLDDKNHIIVND